MVMASQVCELPAKGLPREASHVLVVASASLKPDAIWKTWAWVPNGCQPPLKPYAWQMSYFLGTFDVINCFYFLPQRFLLIVFKQSKAVWECQRSTHGQVTWCSDQPERQSAHWKRLSRKTKLLWPQTAFLNLMNDIFIKVNRGANEKHSNMIIIASVSWGLSCYHSLFQSLYI